jgi:hypothetical protein
LQVLESVSIEDFGTIEQKILQLVISYCCYFSKGFPTPSAEYRYSSKEAYYSLALKMANEGGISKKNATQISSLIKDTPMASIFQQREKE